jgi:hypothetical protein
MRFQSRLGLLLFAIALMLLAPSSLFAKRPTNQGGPATERRPLTPAEIDATMRQFGVDPSSDSGPISCRIVDNSGTVVTQVKAMNVGDAGYWLSYLYSGEPTVAEVDFIVLPLFKGSPLPIQTQVFLPNSISSIITPFGIPYWGNNLTSGNWRLVVKNSLGQKAYCDFTVVP